MVDAATPPPHQIAAVRVTEIEGRGRAVVSSQPLRGGDIVLRDSPILLYSAFPLSSPDKETTYCSHCFRIISAAAGGGFFPCPCCSDSSFCSPDCRNAALSSSHTQWLCEALKRLQREAANASSPLFNRDRQVQARFLVAACNLALVSPSNFQVLLSLQGDRNSSGEGDGETALFLHSLISTVCPPPLDQSRVGAGFSVELTAALLAKDKLNAFGLMEPFTSDKAERSVRAYGIYPMASFFNHDCLPNACRFDYVDAAGPPGNTDIIVRLIHDIPQGREICLSYFPVNVKYAERQRLLKEDYGFLCECDRCNVEANWSDQEDDGEDEDGGMEDDADAEEEEEAATDEDDMEAEDSNDANADSDFPHAYFFVRYMCNKDNCGGTLAPLPPTHTTSLHTVMECNVCGNLSNGDELAGSSS